MIFKLYDCDVGIKVNGVSYDFEHVNEVTINDPVFNRLTRGSNAKNKIGLAYKEGLKEPTEITCPITDLDIALKAVLDDAFENQVRVDFYCISRKDGSSKMAKNSILCQKPQQLTVGGDSPESLDVILTFQTFDSAETHKS